MKSESGISGFSEISHEDGHLAGREHFVARPIERLVQFGQQVRVTEHQVTQVGHGGLVAGRVGELHPRQITLRVRADFKCGFIHGCMYGFIY